MNYMWILCFNFKTMLHDVQSQQHYHCVLLGFVYYIDAIHSTPSHNFAIKVFINHSLYCIGLYCFVCAAIISIANFTC